MAHRLYPHSEARLAKLRGEDEVLRLNLVDAGLSFPECWVAFLAALFACGDAEIAFEAARQQALLMCPPLGGDDGEPRVRGRAQLIAALRDLPNPYSQPPGAIQKGNTDITPTEHSSLGAGPVDLEALGSAMERLDHSAIQQALGFDRRAQPVLGKAA